MQHNHKRPIDQVDGADHPKPSKAPRSTSVSVADDEYDLSQPLAGSGKRKSTGVPRTGQACDRCKNRKIRCDDTEGGCLPCRQNNTECRTTDRITQRATVRGHTEAVERENQHLRAHVYTLEQQMRDAGLQVKPHAAFVPPPPPPPPPTDSYPTGWSSYAPQSWDSGATNINGSIGYHEQSSSGTATPDRSALASLPPFRPGLSDNYLGVSFNSTLSPVEGTRLSVFGHKVDISQMNNSNDHGDDSSTSLQIVLDHMYQRTQAARDLRLHGVELPERQVDCEQIFELYMFGVNSFYPLLHRPAMKELIQNLYDSRQTGFRPTPAQTVQVHVMLAIMQYQFAIRNNTPGSDRPSMEQQAFSHYYYALCHVEALYASRGLEDIIGLTMISIFLRTLPKPGPAWIITNWSFSVAIDVGLHRSANAWPGLDRSVLEIEQRKRVFWSLMLLHVPLAGKLGRPMMLRLEDYDIELPEPLNDYLFHEDAPNAQTPCTFRGAIEVFKLTEIFCETYAHIYAIRQSTNYEETVRRINLKLEKWKAELPAKFVLGSAAATAAQTTVLASWMGYYEAEMILILHHPALCNSSSNELKARNLDVCAKAAETIIRAVADLNEWNALSSSWLDTTSYLAAIFTLLFANWERRDRMNAESSAALRKLLETSNAVINTIGQWLGSGHHLRNAVQRTIELGLRKIESYYAQKTASAASATLKQSPKNSPPHIPAHLKQMPSQEQPPTSLHQSTIQAQGASRYAPPQTSPSYNNVHHNYQEANPASMQAYAYHSYNHDTASYPENQEALMFNATGYNPYCSPGPQAWRQWTDQMENNDKSAYDGNLLLAIGGARNMGQEEGDSVPDMSGSMGNSIPNMMPHAGMNAHVVNWPMAAGYGHMSQNRAI